MESEAQTRKRRIDARLEAAGWPIVPFRDDLDINSLRLHAVEEYPTGNGPADYTLVVGGQILGIVKAKKHTPYSQGVKANVIFFQKGLPTEDIWIFDARSNVLGITKKDRPLRPQHFAEFEKCYGSDPNGQSKPKRSRYWKRSSATCAKSSPSSSRKRESRYERPLATPGIHACEPMLEFKRSQARQRQDATNHF